MRMGDPCADRPSTRLATRLSFFVAGFTMAAWAPLVPYAKMRLGADDRMIGLFLLCIGIGSIIAMPLTGLLVARIGSRLPVLVGGAGLSIVLPVLAIAPSAIGLAVALLLFGASLGMLDVAINVHAIEVEKAAPEPLMSGFHAMFSLGGLVGSGGVTVLLANGVSSLAAAGSAAAIAVLALFAAASRLLRSRPHSGAPIFAWPRGVVVLVGALAFVAFLAEGVVLDWGALFLTDTLGLAVSQGGIGYALFSVAMLVGRLTGDQLVSRLGGTRVLFAGGLLVMAGFAWLVLVPVESVALGGFLVIGLGAANLVPLLFSAAGRQQAMPHTLAVASITTMGYAGILIGPALIGLVADEVFLRFAFAMVCGLVLSIPLLCSRVPGARAHVRSPGSQ